MALPSLRASLATPLKRFIAGKYLRVSLKHIRYRLKETAPRSFTRVYVVAELSRNCGIVQGARLQQKCLARAGVTAQLLDSTGAIRNPMYRVDHEPGTAYIFHSGGPQIATQMMSVMPHAAKAYRIAYWAWELPVAPRSWPLAEGLVSEIWTCSDFAKKSLEQRYSVPIFSVPHVIHPSRARPKTYRDRFEVLAFADSRSSLRRKNPEGALMAFSTAFGKSDRARLTLKLTGKGGDCREILQRASQMPNVRLITDYLDDAELQKLFEASHVLLSLHRAEGFGLPMLEAMSHGIPVIATNWSGNLDYMDSSNGMLVPCSMIPIGKDPVYGNYAETLWAEPDIDQAAQCLKSLSSDRNLYCRLSADALKSVAAWAAAQSPPI